MIGFHRPGLERQNKINLEVPTRMPNKKAPHLAGPMSSVPAVAGSAGGGDALGVELADELNKVTPMIRVDLEIL
jgi:hypothetical protein